MLTGACSGVSRNEDAQQVSSSLGARPISQGCGVFSTKTSKNREKARILVIIACPHDQQLNRSSRKSPCIPGISTAGSLKPKR